MAFIWNSQQHSTNISPLSWFTQHNWMDSLFPQNLNTDSIVINNSTNADQYILLDSNVILQEIAFNSVNKKNIIVKPESNESFEFIGNGSNCKLSVASSLNIKIDCPIVLSSNIQISVAPQSVLLLNGIISGNSEYNITISGGGTVIYGANNTYNGNLVVQDNSILQMGNGGSTGDFGSSWKMVAASCTLNNREGTGRHAQMVTGIKTDNTLWGWGYNSGNISFPTDDSRVPTPIQIGTDKWKHIAIGSTHIIGIKTNGTMWCWGSNTKGELGTNQLGFNFPWNSAVQITGISGVADDSWIKASAGRNVSAAINSDGKLFVAGDNTYCQMGLDPVNIPLLSKFTQFGSNTDWIDVKCGLYCIMGARKNTQNSDNLDLHIWGTGFYGEFGNGSIEEMDYSPHKIECPNGQWTKFAVRAYSIAAINSNNELFTWGDNTYGQLGIDSEDIQITNITKVGTDNDWKDIQADFYNIYAIKDNGTLWGSGDNAYSQLDANGKVEVSTGNNSKVFIQINDSDDPWFPPFWDKIIAVTGGLLAIDKDGKLYFRGQNNSGQGTTGKVHYTPTPVKITNATDWKKGSLGTANAVIIKQNGTMWVIGSNTATGTDPSGNTIDITGILGIDTHKYVVPRVPVQIGKENSWLDVSSGSCFSIAIKRHENNNYGTLWGWGRNDWGQLGLGDTVHRSKPTQIGNNNNWKYVHGVGFHVVAININNELYIWGSNQYNQLGYDLSNSTTTRYSPIPQKLDGNWTKAVAGDGFTIALKSDGSLWSCGRNSSGQLGQGITSSLAPFSLPFGQIDVTTSGGINENWVNLYSGAAHVVAMKKNLTTQPVSYDMYVWGSGSYGQIGNGSYIAVNKPSKINSTGWNPNKVYAGGNSIYAHKFDNTLWNWGSSDYGELGRGNFNWPSTPTILNLDGGNFITAFGGGSCFMGIKADGSLHGCGYDAAGRIATNYTSTIFGFLEINLNKITITEGSIAFNKINDTYIPNVMSGQYNFSNKGTGAIIFSMFNKLNQDTPMNLNTNDSSVFMLNNRIYDNLNISGSGVVCLLSPVYSDYNTINIGDATLISNSFVVGNKLTINGNKNSKLILPYSPFGNLEVEITNVALQMGMNRENKDEDIILDLESNDLDISGFTSNSTLTVVTNEDLIFKPNNNFTELIKLGNAKMTIQEDNLFNGKTTVNMGELILNGNMENSPLIINNGILKGTGTSGSLTINNNGKLSFENPTTLLYIKGDLNLKSGSKTVFGLISDSAQIADRGSQYNGINVSGNVYIENDTTIDILLAAESDEPVGSINVANDWWDNNRVWNFIQTDTDKTINGMFDTYMVHYSGLTDFIANESEEGNFYAIPNTDSHASIFFKESGPANKLLINWRNSTIVGGDPHIKPLFGPKYTLENKENCYNLLDTLVKSPNKIVINAKCWFLPENLLNDFKKINTNKQSLQFMQDYTFIRYISIMCGDEKLIIDMETLEPVQYTSENDVNSFKLETVKNNTKYKNIVIEDICEDANGLYSITHKHYRQFGETFTRNISIKNNDCTVHLTLSKDFTNDDRNSMEIKIDGKRKLSRSNYKGALIEKCQCRVDKLV
jgi:alpha-tubulin suppressor-like RCC1 family protein